MTDETERELRARLGAKDVDDPPASIHAAPRATPGQSGTASAPARNPYLVALVTLTCIFAAIAVILYITGATQNQYGDDPAGQLADVSAGNSWLSFAGLMFLGAMIVGGITWHSDNSKK